MDLVEFSKKCPTCQTSFQSCIYEYLWEEDWAYDWYGRFRRWEHCTRRFKIQKKLGIEVIGNNDFREVEDISPSSSDYMPNINQFLENPGLGGSKVDSRWSEKVQVLNFSEESKDAGSMMEASYEEFLEEEAYNYEPHESTRAECRRKTEKLIFKCEDCEKVVVEELNSES